MFSESILQNMALYQKNETFLNVFNQLEIEDKKSINIYSFLKIIIFKPGVD